MIEERNTGLDLDITQRFLQVLATCSLAKQARDELAKVTCETINAKSVQWVPHAIVDQLRGVKEEQNEDVESELTPYQHGLVSALSGRDRPLIQACEEDEGATDIGIELPASGILLCRLVASPGALPSFVALLKLAAGYFVLADQMQQKNLLQSSLVSQALRQSLQDDLFQSGSSADALKSFCEKVKQAAGASKAFLYLTNTVENPSRGSLFANEVLSDQKGETARLVRELACESVRGGSELDEAMSNRATVPSRSATNLANRLGVESVACFALDNPEGNASGAVILAGSEFNENRLAESRRAVKAAAPALKFRYSSKGSRKSRKSSRLAMTILLLALLVGILFIPVPHQVHSTVSLVPTSRRFVAAPYDGVLKQAVVRSGQRVQKGELLGSMDVQALQLEKSELQAEAIRLGKQIESYLSEGAIEKMQMGELRLQEVKAAIQLVDDRIRQSKIVSPIDGFILSHDLDDVENSPVALGQNLFEVAPMRELRAELEVPGRRAVDLTQGQAAQIWIENGDGMVREGQISRVSPITEIREGRNVVVCEVVVPNETELLRPGMSGRAAIQGENRPVGWILFHRLWERVRVYVGV